MSSKVSLFANERFLFIIYFVSWQKESPLDSLLHSRARLGDSVGVKHVLDSGRVDPDCRDKVIVRIVSISYDTKL